MSTYILTRKDGNGNTVVSRSKNLGYINSRMYEDWMKVLGPIKEKDSNHRRCFFVGEYAFVEGIASWSITIE
jgi:hypothetical protein